MCTLEILKPNAPHVSMDFFDKLLIPGTTIPFPVGTIKSLLVAMNKTDSFAR